MTRSYFIGKVATAAELVSLRASVSSGATYVAGTRPTIAPSLVWTTHAPKGCVIYVVQSRVETVCFEQHQTLNDIFCFCVDFHLFYLNFNTYFPILG